MDRAGKQLFVEHLLVINIRKEGNNIPKLAPTNPAPVKTVVILYEKDKIVYQEP